MMERREVQAIPLRDLGPIHVRRALQGGAEFLFLAGLESSRLDAELLLGKALGCSREKLYVNYETALGIPEKSLYCSLLERRARREPLPYIIGRREFWSLDFDVTPDVLVPRPETELLVAVTLELGKKLDKGHVMKILDLGTGSGVIAVSLAKELADVEIWATDLSAKALGIAQANALRHGVGEKIRFLQGNLFGPVAGQRGFFDVVVSNPPYVRADEMDNLPPEVRDWEPRVALDGGSEGLDFYRRILGEAHRYLVHGGLVALEIGADMRSEVDRLIASVGCYSSVLMWQDYAGLDRVVVAQKLPRPSKVGREAPRSG